MAEDKTCTNTKGVAITPKGKVPSLLDCASLCIAKPQNKYFALENTNGCATDGCQCNCIESATDDCVTSNDVGFTLFKFRAQKEGMCFDAPSKEYHNYSNVKINITQLMIILK